MPPSTPVSSVRLLSALPWIACIATCTALLALLLGVAWTFERTRESLEHYNLQLQRLTHQLDRLERGQNEIGHHLDALRHEVAALKARREPTTPAILSPAPTSR